MKRTISTPLLDCLLILVLILLYVLVLPQPQGDAAEPPGQIIVEISWPEGAHDIDLWVKAPGDESVGYSRLSGRVFNLLRDDLGTRHDPLPLNYENAYSRGAPDGHWAATVHYYGGRGAVTVQAVVSRRTETRTERLFGRTVTLAKRGDQATIGQWVMAGGRMLPDSLHYSPIDLRAAP